MAEETDKPWTPCVPPPMPPRARLHCRHYSYGNAGTLAERGPRCAVGVDLTGPGAALACMPPDSAAGKVCDKREDWTAEERAVWAAWTDEHMRRAIVILSAIPSEGHDGIINPCPGCGVGMVSWVRVRSNKHLHAYCTTERCFSVMQ